FGRTAEMGGQHHCGAGLQAQADAGQGGADAGVVGKRSVGGQRHVEVGAQKDALAAQPPIAGEVFEAEEVGCAHHSASIIATAVSSMRLEKPHSLSYQAVTLTKLSSTRVRVASKMLECGSWLKSQDTSGSSFTARMSRRRPWAASRTRSFTSFTV